MTKPMTLGSLFAGIGGFDLGFERAGFETLWQVEKESFCIAVLRTRFPNAERYYEIKDCGGTHAGRKHKLKPVDVITAGVPCQDVSMAGKRAGLAGERTGLFYEFARILQEVRPAWFVFENVPGLLSSNRGRDFAEILRVLMVECGYGVCWRVLDSQFFGVAQRRRRVFIVGHFGEPCPAEVLFEREGSEGNPAQSGEESEDVAANIAAGIAGTSYGGASSWPVQQRNVLGRRPDIGYAGLLRSGEGTDDAGETEVSCSRIIAGPLASHGHRGSPGSGPGRNCRRANCLHRGQWNWVP